MFPTQPADKRAYFFLGPQQCPEPSLLEVFVRRQRLKDTSFTHNNELHTIYQAPALIKTGSIQREGFVKQSRVKMNYLDFAGGEKVVYNLNRHRSKVLCQRITNFEEYRVRRKKSSLFKLRGEV